MPKIKLEKLKLILLTLIISIFFGITSQAQAASPVLYFSDLTDGPVSGWNGSPTKGAAVSIWGNNFGSSRGNSYVTIGGVNLTNDSDYAEWGATTNPTTARGLERITFWLNSDMTLGDTTITVTTSDGTSQSIPFYTRNTGHIYFVSPSGDDNNTGLNDSNQMFRHPYKAKQIMQAGDIAYIRSGTYTAYEYEGSHKALLVFGVSSGAEYSNGSVHNSITMTSYPGEVATLGNEATTEHAYWQAPYGSVHTVDYWTFSKFKITTNDHCFSWESSISTNHNNYFRIVGNDLTSKTTVLTHGHLINIFSNFRNSKILGNYGHDTGKDDNGNFVYKTLFLYFCGGGISDNVEVAWNHTFECAKPMQVFGHWDTDRVSNLSIHDNLFDTSMSGSGAFVVGGGDPQNGGEQYTFVQNAKIYNNLFVNIGADFRIEGTQNGFGGNYEVYNNTFYDVGGSGATLHIVNPSSFKFYNNIIYLTNANSYYDNSNAGYPGYDPTNIEDGKNNLWFGGSNKPNWSYDDIENIDPLFINPANNDLHLQSTSPARNTGTTIPTVVKDFDGLTRPQGSTYDIGAYEFIESSGTEIRADVDQNSTINSTDAMLTLRNSLGLDMSSTNWVPGAHTGDVNCDNTTNSADAMLILRKSLGLDMSETGWCD